MSHTLNLHGKSGVRLFPRRKAGDNVFPEKGRLPVKVDQQTIENYFAMPQPAACKALAISLTALKQVCRKLGIARWPYQRPCKRGKRYLSRTASACEVPAQDAISIIDTSIDADREWHTTLEESAATALRPTLAEQDSLDEARAKEHDYDRLHQCMKDSADSCTSDSAYSCSSASTAAGISPGHWGDAASIACSHDSSHQEVHVATLHADDHDLGWLVEGDDDLVPLADDVAFEIAWCERYYLAAQRLGTERSCPQYPAPAGVRSGVLGAGSGTLCELSVAGST